MLVNARLTTPSQNRFCRVSQSMAMLYHNKTCPQEIPNTTTSTSQNTHIVGSMKGTILFSYNAHPY